jgi:hypothetical protein
MKMKGLFVMGLLTFLIGFTLLNPVIADGWGDPLATDPADDAGIDPEEDINTVDVRVTNDFVQFRFVMNHYLIKYIYYAVKIDLDKNFTTGFHYPDSDIGCDVSIFGEVVDMDNIETEVTVAPYPSGYHSVSWNMTAGNHSVMDWSSPALVPYLQLVTLDNSSQGEIVFGVDWTWLRDFLNYTGDACSVYLEFECGWDTDHCPDRTANATDYIEWEFCQGIPSFSTELALFSILSLLGAAILLQKNRIQF